MRNDWTETLVSWHASTITAVPFVVHYYVAKLQPAAVSPVRLCEAAPKHSSPK